MKKRGLMIAALVLVAALLSGCALPTLLISMTQPMKRETPQPASTNEPMPMMEEADYAFVMEGPMESGLVANTGMAAMSSMGGMSQMMNMYNKYLKLELLI